MARNSVWTEEDSEAAAKSLLQEAGRSEWPFQAIKERLEEEPYFERLRAASEQDFPEEMEVYDEKLNDIALDVEACMDWPEDEGDGIEDEPLVEGDWVVGEH